MVNYQIKRCGNFELALVFLQSFNQPFSGNLHKILGKSYNFLRKGKQLSKSNGF